MGAWLQGDCAIGNLREEIPDLRTYGACRDRTGDLRLAKAALSQLS